MTPVFIGACPRSGTTLLGSALGMASEATATPESQFKFGLMARFAKQNFDAIAATEYLLSHPRFRLWNFELQAKQRNRLERSTNIAAFLRTLVNSHAGKEQSFWIDHTPDNVKYFGNLKAVFPDAKLIHLVRDGRGIASSLKSLDWGPNFSQAAARRWAEVLAQGLAAESAMTPNDIMRLSYEDLLEDPEFWLKKVCEFAGIQFVKSMLNPSDDSLPEYTRSQHALVGKGFSPARSQAWKTGLSGREIEIYEYIAGDLLQFMGYEPIFGISARPPNRSERLKEKLRTNTAKPRRKIRNWIRRIRFG